MNAAFGIDHPLIATHDIIGLRSRLSDLGFNMTPIGQHPWGTNTSLAMFNGCLLEIMGIYDETLIDEVPAGEFKFGRHVYSHLQQREGVALTALHSTDSIADAKTAAAAGLKVAGHLEFGRDVTTPDGKQARTKTTLALLPNKRWPRLSFFLCQQHRPELIYVPEWLEHKNSVCGLAGISILADQSLHPALSAHFAGLYGEARACDGGFSMQTANGQVRVLDKNTVQEEYGILLSGIADEHTPCIVAMDFWYRDEAALLHCFKQSHSQFSSSEDSFVLNNPAETGNVIFRMLKG